MVLTSARNTMPALDYVSIIRSVYGDRKAMLAGAFASVVMAAMAAYKTNSLALYAVTAAFVLIGAIRYLDMRSFQHAAIGNEDAAAAEYWENRAVVFGGALSLVYGMWCLVSMAVVQDPFASLSSASISIAVMVGICGRNFGLDRLVTIQMVGVIVPLSIGYAMHGDIYHYVLAGLLVIMLTSFRKLAGDIRAILLAAVHGREDASRLAAELDMAMTTLEHGLCMLDDRGVISVANARALRLFSALGQPDLVGRPFSAVLTDLNDSKVLPSTALDRLADLITLRSGGKVLLCLPESRYFEVTISVRRERCVLLFEDISERVAAEERINFMARHDTLTGLPNRSYFGELASDDLAGRRQANAPERMVALTLIDIDDFKHVNDTFGHLVGDELLVQVSERLRRAMPAAAVLARLAGDEFVIYRSAVNDQIVGEDAETLLEAFASPFLLDGLTLSTTVSLGIATSEDPDDLVDDLMTKADLALYSAKGDGKARSRLFHSQMDIDYHYRQRLKSDLREAVAAGALELAFQPIMDINRRRVVSCEALARWDHPELGAIPPSTFIPLAEEMGLISDITAWVVQRATQQCSQWPGDVSVAVNISARDFRVGDLERVVEEALASSGLVPERLEIEVTETAAIEEHEIAQRMLTRFARQGIAIALDDFGTGYSSLSYLNSLPLSKLKIDRSFLADIAQNARSLRLLANVARLGRDLDLTVVAEGVETEAQLQTILGNVEIQQVQGYHFSKPVPESEIQALIGRLNAAASDIHAKRRLG
ncbi:MAG: EAL domain-containing protein [Candidatus Devosia phytovorans]|uniref:EAL domain-containing protein n=1 Tax=Candidatus Devosia phytovorans TaxID=3121372 RepID=A0AAJ5VT30_9HYPH|nr:EAL domain-containing protein [Devosia sp.]WEK04274.1 MAG: EAL domain-containing protein [Devosia sp.]